MTAPRRIRLSRAKGWRKPEGAVVVARPTKWGNPWRAGAPGTMIWPDRCANALNRRSGLELSLAAPLDAAGAVDAYRRWIEAGVIAPRPPSLDDADCFDLPLERYRNRLLHALPDLRGVDLCCWCALDAPHCHADVLLELANR